MSEGTQKKKARIRRRVSYVLAVLITMVLAVGIYTKSRLLPYQVATYVNDHYLAGTPFTFSCDQINGNYFQNIVFKNPVLRYDSDRASFNVFRADEISVDYQILDVLRLNLTVDDITLTNVRLQVRQDENGALVLPLPTSTEKQVVTTPVTPTVDVKQFNIAGLQMLFGRGETELAIRDVNLSGAFTHQSGTGRLEIDSGSAYIIDSNTPISSVSIDVQHSGDTIDLRNFVVRLEQSYLTATGRYRAGRFERVQLLANPISLAEIHRLGILPELEGEFGGNIIFDGRVDSLGVRGTLTGEGFGVVLGGFSFDGMLADGVVNFDRVDGDVFGARMRGAFMYNTKNGNFDFDGTCASLDLTQGFIPDRGLPETDLNGKLRVIHTAAESRYAWVGELDSAVVDGYVSYNVRGAGDWVDDRGLVVDRLELNRPGYRITGNGTITPGGVGDLIFSVDGSDLTYFWDFFELPRIGGAIAAKGRLVGDLEDFQVNLNGQVVGASFLFASVDSGVVSADVRGVGSDAPEARVDLTGNRVLLAGRAFESPHLRLLADSSGVVVRDATFSRGDTTVTMDFSARTLHDGDTEVLIRHAAIVDPQETWRTSRPTMFRYGTGEMSVDSLVLTSTRGAIGLTGTYSERSRICDVRMWGDNVRLGVLRDAFALPVSMSGTGHFAARLNGDIDNPHASLDLSAVNGAIDSVAFDALEAQVAFDGREYRLTRFGLVAGPDSVGVTGTWAYPVSPASIVRFGFDSGVAFAQKFSIHGDVRTYSLPAFMRALHRTSPIGGAFTGTFAMEGTPDRPTVRVRGRLDPREGPGRRLPTADVNLAYQNGVLNIAELRVRDDIDARLRGTVPMTFSIPDGLVVDHERELALELAFLPRDHDIAIGSYLPNVRRCKGKLTGNLRIAGSVYVPLISGEAALDNGQVLVEGLQERFDDVTARVNFSGDVVRLTSFSARTEDGGSIHGMGQARLRDFRPTAYTVDVFVRNFRLRSIPDVDMLQDGHLTVREVEWRNGRHIPNITGAVDVREATVRLDLAPATGTPSPLTMPSDAPGWVASIDINGHKNIWIRNADLNVEMGGELIFKRDELGTYFRGDLQVLRGSYKVYGNKFQITDGTLNFSASETLRPEVLINAYTPHRNEGGFEKRIYLTLSWPHDKKEPEITLTYDDPGYYESDLWRMLGGSSIAGGLATNTLERILNEQMTGVTIEVEQRQFEGTQRSGDPEQEMIIGVGKYLWEDIYLQYKRGLTVSSQEEVQIEYRLSNMFLLRSQLIRNSRRNSLGLSGKNTDEFNLDIKYRFEY